MATGDYNVANRGSAADCIDSDDGILHMPSYYMDLSDEESPEKLAAAAEMYLENLD